MVKQTSFSDSRGCLSHVDTDSKGSVADLKIGL